MLAVLALLRRDPIRVFWIWPTDAGGHSNVGFRPTRHAHGLAEADGAPDRTTPIPGNATGGDVVKFYRELARTPFGLAVAGLAVFWTACGPDSPSPVTPSAASAEAAAMTPGATAASVADLAALSVASSDPLIQNLKARALPVASETDAARVILTWKTPAPYDGWEWRQREKTGAWTRWERRVPLRGTDVRMLVDGLKQGTSYDFQVRSRRHRGGGSGALPRSTVSVTTAFAPIGTDTLIDATFAKMMSDLRSDPRFTLTEEQFSDAVANAVANDPTKATFAEAVLDVFTFGSNERLLHIAESSAYEAAVAAAPEEFVFS